MGRKARPAMQGLEALGARLKQIRLQSNLSQMKLARLIGFDPSHGYKYVLRLEKGQVPNPTLRTIAACIEACGASWKDIADVLPATGTVYIPAPRSSKVVPASAPSPMTMGPRPPTHAGPVPPPTSRRKDSRPMREQLRSQRLEEREERTRRFWSGVKQAQTATVAMLHTMRVPPSLSRAYVSFARSCCLTIEAFETARPEVRQRELNKLVQTAVAQGLDPKALAQIQSACTQAFHSLFPTTR